LGILSEDAQNSYSRSVRALFAREKIVSRAATQSGLAVSFRGCVEVMRNAGAAGKLFLVPFSLPNVTSVTADGAAFTNNSCMLFPQPLASCPTTQLDLRNPFNLRSTHG
jgi:hypothetical protein